MKSKFKQYKYLGLVIYPELPQPFEAVILDMLQKLDKVVRHKFIPRWFLNFVSTVSSVMLSEFMPSTQITNIKFSFGKLRIYGVFTEKGQIIVNDAEAKCNNMCEFCGNPNPIHVMIKSRVRNVCSTCKETKKYGTNIGNNPSL